MKDGLLLLLLVAGAIAWTIFPSRKKFDAGSNDQPPLSIQEQFDNLFCQYSDTDRSDAARMYMKSRYTGYGDALACLIKKPELFFEMLQLVNLEKDRTKFD